MRELNKIYPHDELPISEIKADFLANFKLPHKSNTPNQFHWTSGLNVRPLLITHPGLDEAYSYLWNETVGKKGAHNHQGFFI